MVDLTGKRFGALTAIRYIPAKASRIHVASWLVRCDCGKEKVINGNNLRRGLVTSCGCGMERVKRHSAAMRAKEQYDDIKGQTFWELTALEYIHHNLWRWRCSCGAETEAKAVDVKNGRIRSCGHVLAETGYAKAVELNVFGHYDGTLVTRLKHIMNNSETKGISPRATSGGILSWTARIQLRGKEIRLGTFASREDAERARREAEKKYWLPIILDYEALKKK